ncbi:MAG TPA: hypothetical protein VLI69_02220 [Gammaproteobacteria bacterium]|nr:hypothetical protein [Gammaproteobacteria bacterium]
MNNIFVILGPARSGTSAITRALKVLEIDLGSNLTRASKTVNPKGFWEDNEVVYKINREIFNKLDCLSSGVTLLDRQILLGDRLKSIEQSAIALVKQRFSNTTSWGFKDPQTSRLIPFWQSVFASLSLNEHYIIALRNPLSSAQSYQNLSGADIETGLLLWLMHLVPAIQETTGKKRIIVSYERLMENPLAELQRLKKNLEITTALRTENVDQYVHEFLDKNLYRNQFSYEDFKSHSATKLFPLCLQTYDLLLCVANDELHFDDEKFTTEWKKILNHLEKDKLFYRYVDSLLKKHHQIAKKLRSIQRSTLWKMLYPLRIIQEGLRTLKTSRS